MDNHQAPELLPAGFLPLTFTNRTTIPTAIPLSSSLQGTSQYLIVLPQGIKPWGILYSRTMWEGFETLPDNLRSGWHGQQDFASGLSYEPTMDTCNQLPNLANQFPEHDMIIPGDTISNLGFGNMFSAVPVPSSGYPEMINHPMAEYLLDQNQSSTELEISNTVMDRRDVSMHSDSQNTQFIPNAASVISQQSQTMLWMSPSIPNDFVPAPSLPELGIRFEEPATFMAPPLLDHQRAHLNT
ncbi:hypothetical protein BDZ91DRAFT_717423 [Kalaharituber pfeilii]|nr:hypothetical protein BDZ91DRAFT_717423 [Kalaharituber pfeilii]